MVVGEGTGGGSSTGDATAGTTSTTATTGPDCETDLCSNPCGNGVRDPDEQCDDGNNIDDDDCTNACTLPKCGDDIVQSGEQCDDRPPNLPLYTTPAPPASACHDARAARERLQRELRPYLRILRRRRS